MTDEPTIADRTASLRPLILLLGGGSDLTIGESLDSIPWRHLDIPEIDALLRVSEVASLGRETSVDEMYLAESCLELERELREREWVAVERALAHVDNAGDLRWPDDHGELVAVAREVDRVGWLREPPPHPIEDEIA